jgi:SprT protein
MKLRHSHRQHLHQMVTHRAVPPNAWQRDARLEGRARRLLKRIGELEMAEYVEVYWHTRLQTSAGQARFPEMRVLLNRRLLEVEEIELEITLRHELAHLLASWRAFPRRVAPHGGQWRTACDDLGIPGENRCHRLGWKRRKVRRQWRYSCPNCGSHVDRVRRFRQQVACAKCCRQHNDGRFTSRFRLVAERL